MLCFIPSGELIHWMGFFNFNRDISNTIVSDWNKETEAGSIVKYGVSEIFNTDEENDRQKLYTGLTTYFDFNNHKRPNQSSDINVLSNY